MPNFEPKILGFLCNWCSYAGADLAGVSRIQYPPNLRIIRVMCSGRLDPVIVLEAFRHGIDGVAVLGCHFGDCHYLTGNYQAERKMKMTGKILARTGLIPDRLYLDWVSAAEGQLFATLVGDFTKKIKELGPLGEPEGLAKEELNMKLLACQNALRTEKLRWLAGKELELVEEQNVYGEKIPQDQFDRLVNENIEKEYIMSRIANLIEDKALSVKEIAIQIEVSPRDVLRHISAMDYAGLVTMVDTKGRSPRYQKIGS